MTSVRSHAARILALALTAGLPIGAFAAPPVGPIAPKIASPTNVRPARSASDCVAHEPFGRAPLCATMFHPGNLFLMWDWQPGTGLTALDGYRIYRVDGGLKQLVATVVHTQTETFAELPLPIGGGYAGKCYAVAAFAGAAESDVSRQFCTDGAPSAAPPPKSPAPTPAPTTTPRGATPAPTPAVTATPQLGSLINMQRRAAAPMQTPTPASKPKFVETTATRIAASSQLNVVAPFNVRSANGYQECAAHVGTIAALICPDMVKNGNVLLVWDWNGPASGPNAVIDGYRVYRVDGSRKDLVDTVRNKKDQTLSVVPKPAGGYTGKCYAATAYAGSRESALSETFCAGGGSAAVTTRLPANHVRSTAQTRRNFGSNSPDSGLIVGFEYFADKQLLGDNYANRIHRAAFAFDVSGLQNRHLVRATLRFTIASSYGAGNNHSCTTDIDTGTEFWWTAGGWLASAHDSAANAGYQIEPGETGPEIAVEVTRVVAPWLTGAPNYGFVLKNRDENLGAFTNKTCVTTYSNPTLELTYY
jgi:hypothetical protein